MSNMVVIGSIPEKISYTFSEERDVMVGCPWDNNYYDADDKPKTVTEKVTLVFPADPGDEKMSAKAKNIAEQAGWNQPKKTSQTIILDNTPITNIRLLSLEQYSNGSVKNYKAVIDKYCVEIGDDVVMDTILKVGIGEGGILKGEYLWSKIGSGMKLIRINSELHRLISEFESKKDMKAIGKNKLEIGGVYQSRNKKKAIFLGYVNTTMYNVADKNSDKYNFEFVNSKLKKAMLFYTYGYSTTLSECLAEISTKIPSGYNFKIKTSHTFIEKINQIDLPENTIKLLRDRAISEMKNKIVAYAGHRTSSNGYYTITPSYLQYIATSLSPYLNLYEFNHPEVDLFEIKKYLIFT